MTDEIEYEAGSCELAMMCCITFASETSKFGEPEIRFSSSPLTLIMPWLIGLKTSRELLDLLIRFAQLDSFAQHRGVRRRRGARGLRAQ